MLIRARKMKKPEMRVICLVSLVEYSYVHEEEHDQSGLGAGDAEGDDRVP